MTADCADESGLGLGGPAKIMIADDHPLVCAALTHTLRSAMPSAMVLTVSSLSAIEAALAGHPDLDLALLDLHMPGARGFSALLLLRGQRPELPVIVISSNDHPRTIARAQQFGAAGFLPKSAPLAEMLAAIASVMAGGTCFPLHRAARSEEDTKLAARLSQLTPQQMRVLMCIADGLLNKQIAYELHLAQNTVKVHVAAVLHKLGCHTRTHAALLAKGLEAEGGAPSCELPEAV
ncbi:MAG TPA: response regulator transcription factor [Steroidobacteraceae bacterium]|nr:response regulator transcription factor [Steroidobacteraceae bacterium]